MNVRANQIAHHLRGLGVGPEVRVGIAMGRSVDAVCAILGVLKSGGAYVPFDPSYPPQRLAFMLEDAAIRVLLTERALLPLFPATTAAVICLDDDDGVPAEPSANLERAATAGDLAYVIYTSGSTGRSKGVAMPHAPLLNLIAWQLGSYAVPGPARTLHFASMSFDVSFQEIFSTWSSGGTLVIVPEEVRRDPPALARLLVEREVERAYFPPVVLRHLAEAIEREGTVPARLREIITAGEALQITGPIAALLAQLAGCTLQNQYGPTETHVVTAFTVPTPVVVGMPSIGRPIANTQIHLLDADLAPVPPFEPGELYVGGAALARGYLGRPELTAERFIADPFYGRLYRTGDRARWQPDGTLEFLGRVDHQVKIRGFRVELGEIEAALATHPGVGHAAVTAQEGAQGERRLVAYLVARDPAAPPPAGALRRHLAETLPEHMVPAAFVVLDALPLLPSGKLDRAALATSEARSEAGSEGAAERPRTPVEEVLAGLWADVLRLDRVGREDDFFALGGHSLHATQVVARVGRALGVELSQRTLFEARTVALLAERVEAARRKGDRPVAPPLVAMPRGGVVPLSYAQQQLWVIDWLYPGEVTYNVPLVARLGGRLDAGALERSLAEIVRRHEALRTTFALVDGEPRQVIGAPSFTMPVVNLADLPAVAAEAEASRLAAEDAHRPFDLARGPLFRATLLRLSARAHVLLMNVHHIVSDGWSLSILAGELGALYDAFAAGRPSPLPALPVQLRDVALRERQWLSGPALGEQLAYWKEQLREVPVALELPTDWPRPAVESHRGAHHRFLLPPELAAALAALGRREGVTLFMTLLAAFQVLLRRYSGQDDFVVGSSIAGRTRVETEGLIGYFTNTLALRADLGGEPTFRELLARVREVTLGAYAHQEVPFEKLVEALAPARDSSRSILFQVMLVLQNLEALPPSLGELEVRWHESTTGTAKLDLTLLMTETDRGIEGSLEYATDLFDAETIARMAGHLQVLLEGAVADPSRRLAELPLLTAEEERTLASWSDAALEHPRGATLHELFEQQVDATPDAPAATCEGTTLSYRELDARANRVAHYLAKRGVGPGVLVGLATSRSLNMLVGLIGVLKAGGAYLPLDPEYPRDRLAFMVEDAGVSVVLTETEAASALPERGAELLRLDADGGALAEERADRLPRLATPDDLAYVIYTSGSTGKPKGAMVEHHQVVRLFEATSPWYRFGARDVWTVFHSYAFDFSVWEIWGALLHGGRVVIVPYLTSRDPEAFHALLGREGVTVLNQTPSAFRQLLRADESAAPEARAPLRLRYVIFGGEALDVGDLRPWWERHGDEHPRLINMYGITETTVHVTYRPLGIADLERPWSSVIGRPIPDLRVHILDAARRPVPIGVPGEMYVGGAGVARGYLNRPELTADRFRADPLRGGPGARLYKTGDLARYLRSGDIEYLGRADDQVKIRGFRVELGEIEAELRAHPAVRESVVLVREDEPGDKRLVGYLVARDPASPPAGGELRAHLSARLPDHMVPAAFMVLDALPLTTHGKVDRKALPALSGARPGDERAFVAPRTATEDLLVGLWAEVLRLARVSVHDDFFALGGHSLLGMRVMARLGLVFGVELPVRTLFEARTVALLAERVDAARSSGDWPAAPPLVAAPRRAELPLSHAQQVLWLFERLHPGTATYNIPLVARLEGPLDAAALERSLAEIVRRHEALRTTFALVDGEPHQVIGAPSFTVPVVDLAELAAAAAEAEASRLAAEDARRPFDLARGPLFRATLLRLSERVHVLSICMHHVVGDGWSLSVLAGELSALYGAFSAGLPSPLPELAVQLADVAVWQRQWLSGAALDDHLTYWKERLRGAPPVLDLPADRPRPAVESHRGATHAFTLPQALAAALVALSRREGVTLFMTLLAAFQVLLHRYTGQDDLVVGSAIAGRTHVEMEGLIGFFVNTLALRTDLGGDPTFRELLARVREETLGAYAHQDVPFDRVVEELAPVRDLGRSPLIQTRVVLQNAPALPLSLPGLRVEWHEATTGTAKLDLTLLAQETARGIEATLEYATDLFDATTIARMAGHLTTLLEGIAADPARRLHELALLTAEEREQLAKWNATATEYPRDTSIHAVFEAQVRATPDAVAVSCGDAELTYRELDHRGDQLARRLRRAGVRSETPVGLLLPRSPEMVVAILAVLKAGGAYVPLDPGEPRARLAWMLEDARVPLVVTRGPLPEGLPPGIHALQLEREADAIAQEDGARLEAPAPPTGGDSLAYVMYTSGSTGRPKGVCVIHRGVVRLVKQASYARLTADEVLLQLAPTAFDASTFEIWGALLNGGRLVVFPGDRPSFSELEDVIRRGRVTTLWLTAGLFNAVIEARPQALASLRQLLVGGEALSVPHVQKALAELPGVAIINGYGPTEGTTFTCCFAVTGAAGLASIPIGLPIANTTAHVLDRHLAPVPVGVPGELYAGGDGIARGYLSRPQLTAERFVPDPFAADPAARLYRTGDRVRRLPDGNLEFLGRLDQQVKIRGHRVEVGEIEAALSSHPAVRACVVTAREDTLGDRRLCAYAVLGEAVTAAALREHLAATLPDYLVPAAFVTLEALPLTPSGKVDRKALPAPSTSALPGDERAFAAPRTPAEELLAGIWAEVLRLDRVGVHDDFFALGGHSLIATRVIARLGSAFGVELPLRALFEAPTVARLSARIDAARHAGHEARPVPPPITRAPRDVELPLSFAQQRMWFLDQLEPGSGAYNMPGAVRLTGLLDVPALGRSLEEIARRHEALRTTFPAVEGRPRQVIAAEPALPLRVEDLEALAPEALEVEVRRRIAAEADEPFDLAHTPPVRATLLRLAERRHVLLLTIHHIAGDGWSLGVLVRELGALYSAFHEGRPSPLPELPLQCADHAVWQRRWLSGAVLEEQLSYWRQQLGGAPAALDLPTDQPRPAHQTFRGATRSTRLPRALAAAIEAASRHEGVTLFMTLLAALQTLLHLHAGEDDILVGSPIAGRTRVETEDIVGFFANTLVLRTDLSGDPTFRELLGRVREVTLGAYDHQEVPFERLVEELRVPRDLSRNPLFQVMLVLQNTPPSELTLGGLTLAEEPVEMATTRFDLLFDVTREEEHLALSLTYSTDLFDATTVEQMLTDLAALLQRFTSDPGQPLSAARAWVSRRALDLAVVATFTADPIEEALAMWRRELRLDGRIRLAPYGQVFQELLDPGSLLARNRDGANVILVRFEDWMRAGREDLEQSAADLVAALKGASGRCPAPHLVVLCPPSPAALAQPELAERLHRLEGSVAAALASTSAVHLLTFAEIEALYPVADLHDPYSDSEGHIPYTPLYFAALATAVMRRLASVLGAPYKVIVLDCDETLWKGVAGEVGPAGVEIDPPRRFLQELLVEQQQRGMLLCLCSKNNEADVLEVFDRHPEMPLRREHVLAHRINWRPKSENLVSLAAELGLGLDSFVFVDDSPLECAEVRARCPEVMTLSLPAEPAAIPQALRHVWAFDHLHRSKEDEQRTLLYRQNAQRERLRGEVPTLQAFIAGLDLHVGTSAMAPEHLERVSQLTQRTNQLNFTTVRRTEADLQQRLASGELEGLVTEVRDRFGDYGLVGAVLFAPAAGALRVDTFLLSCRALGRGVEVRTLKRLGEIAQERGLARVELGYRRSKKNKPALELLESVARAFAGPTDDGYLFDVPAGELAALDVAAHLSQVSPPADARPSAEAPAAPPPQAARRAFVVPDHVHLSLDSTREGAEADADQATPTPRAGSGPRGAAHAGGRAGRGHLGRRAGRRDAGRPRRLLPARRPLAPGHPGALPPLGERRCRAAAARALRGPDRGPPDPAHRRGPAHGRAAGGAADHARAARRGAAAVLRPAAPLAAPSDRARQLCLQPDHGGAPRRGARRGRARAEPRRDCPAPRGAADDVRLRGRRAEPGDRGALVLAARDRPHGAPRARAGGGGAEARRRGGDVSLRPRARTAVPSRAAAARRARAPALDLHAPRHLRRLVVRRPHPGAGGALRGVLRRPPLAPRGAADPARGPCPLAAPLALGGGAGRAARLLEGAARRRASGAGAAHGSPALGRPERAEREPDSRPAAGAGGGAAPARPGTGGDAVHDPARGLPGVALPSHGARRPVRRHALRRADQGRAGAAHRGLHQHAGAAHAPLRGAPLHHAARTRTGDDARGLRSSGRAVRSAGRGGAARAAPRPHPALPGPLQHARRARRLAGAARPLGAARGDGRRRAPVRSDPVRPRAGGRDPPPPRLSVRAVLRRAHGVPARADAVPARSDRRGPRRRNRLVLAGGPGVPSASARSERSPRGAAPPAGRRHDRGLGGALAGSPGDPAGRSLLDVCGARRPRPRDCSGVARSSPRARHRRRRHRSAELRARRRHARCAPGRRAARHARPAPPGGPAAGHAGDRERDPPPPGRRPR